MGVTEFQWNFITKAGSRPDSANDRHLLTPILIYFLGDFLHCAYNDLKVSIYLYIDLLSSSTLPPRLLTLRAGLCQSYSTWLHDGPQWTPLPGIHRLWAPLPNWLELPCIIPRILWKWRSVTFKPKLEKTLGFSVLPSWITCSEEASSLAVRTSSSLVVKRERGEGLRPPINGQPCGWAILAVDLPATVKLSGDHGPGTQCEIL